ncbi:tRNA glutamyl-Q(34) synthetase GluQRS [Marinobacter nauticus]|uniref:tRNA glutamyl-Q(34) synthetase GluQRS n=1 Tax=Marinobacter nauticus TaxID=2743 RepID=UPI000EB52FD2|nr:tRNA glutamyl-Q(34) synthetase GluQRS [Marinobacter nauticus]MBW3199528.1 tRNA glutamyl-Q(34) synthetase GluQRS [Marinobacter nauticus]MBY6184944.1 tRNA glutamyl-Q(34) synthetase GluQRS [Marinobacter nauticus]RKR72638.1 glutamyl-Q tRNA(Asp) synthetase [Marinobacter nauticus]
MATSRYRGRFAPSPTGPLHFGSLVTALASWLEAKLARGDWLVRIEDLDPLREPPEATGQILHSLECHGLFPDESVRFQSRRHDAYQSAIETLLAQNKAYRCRCSRKQLKDNHGYHPNRCQRGDTSPGDGPHAVRFALEEEASHWQDDLLGPQVQMVHAELDDPVILRKEGFYAYQLAVVVDDIDQGITHVVRGSDLLDMTAQQQQVFRALGAEPPHWLHIPVIVNEQGQKLSKQTHAPALDDDHPARNLFLALQALGQQPEPTLARATVEEVLNWAEAHWQRSAIPLTSGQARGITGGTLSPSDR